ncbi:MAG: putative porin [Saprospiraceae bacterium]|nr:putative porin [Saprospiraceae bacterium]
MPNQALSKSSPIFGIARFGIAIVLMTCAHLLYAQFPSSRDDDFNQGVRRPGEIRFERDTSQQEIEAVQDTFGVFYFFIDNPNQVFPWQDTTLLHLHQYDPTKKNDEAYRTLGNFGSAHQFINYQPSNRKGFDIGYHQYDAYYIQPEQLQFNLIAYPFSQVAYSKGATQSDGFFKGKFSRNFNDGFRFTIQAQTIRQLGVARQYPRQRLEQAAVGTGLWWDAPNGNYDGFLYFTSNSTQADENGGVISLPVVGDGAIGGINPQTATVFLPDGASTRHAQKTVGYLQQWKLFQNDSIIKPAERNFTATHQVEWKTSSYKFFDNFDADSEELRRAYYGDLFTDTRGLRVFIRHNTIQNTFQLSTFRKAATQSDELAAEKDRIQVGIAHHLHFIHQDGVDTTLNNLLLTGRIDFRLKNRIQLNTYGHLDFLDNRGDFQLRGDLMLDVGKIGQLSATFINQAYQPALVQDQFYVTQKQIWNNNFKKHLKPVYKASYRFQC